MRTKVTLAMIITGILIGISCSKDDDVPEADTA